MLVPQERSTRGEQGSVRNFSLIVFAQHESRQEPRGGLQRPANSVGSTIRVGSRIEGAYCSNKREFRDSICVRYRGGSSKKIWGGGVVTTQKGNSSALPHGKGFYHTLNINLLCQGFLVGE